MQKLKLLIMLALLPAAMIGCGKTDSEKAKDGAKAGNHAIAKAEAAWDEYLTMTNKALEDDKLTEEEVLSIKTKLEECRDNYKYALKIDASSKDIKMANRAVVESNLAIVEKQLARVNAVAESIALAKAEADKKEPKK